jgi:hypothetical protein
MILFADRALVVDFSFSWSMQVDDAFEGILLADWELHSNGFGLKTICRSFRRRAGSQRRYCIHLVDECDTGNMVVVSLTPNRFRLRSERRPLRTENGNGAVQYAQRAFNFNGEVYVPRSIDDVDAVSFPVSRS